MNNYNNNLNSSNSSSNSSEYLEETIVNVRDDFSKQYILDMKKDLALQLLKLLGITSFTDQKYITYSDLQNPIVLKKFKLMFPALKTVFKVSKIRALNIHSWNRCKHPGVNLLRQILKDIGYKLHLINEYQGNRNGKKAYNTKYIIIAGNIEVNMTPKTLPPNYISSKPLSLMEHKEFEDLKNNITKNIHLVFDEDEWHSDQILSIHKNIN
jgi:hypothetical protein